MSTSFDRPIPLTELELDAIWNEAASEVGWIRRQMLIAEGLDPDSDCSSGKDNFCSLFPAVAFGSELWLKRLIVPVLCLAYQDIKDNIRDEQARLNADPDKYVHLIIPPRQKKFFLLVNELQKQLPWVVDVLDPKDEPSAIAVLGRLKHLGLGAKVRIRYADLNEERIVA